MHVRQRWQVRQAKKKQDLKLDARVEMVKLFE